MQTKPPPQTNAHLTRPRDKSAKILKVSHSQIPKQSFIVQKMTLSESATSKTMARHTSIQMAKGATFLALQTIKLSVTDFHLRSSWVRIKVSSKVMLGSEIKVDLCLRFLFYMLVYVQRVKTSKRFGN